MTVVAAGADRDDCDSLRRGIPEIEFVEVVAFKASSLYHMGVLTNPVSCPTAVFLYTVKQGDHSGISIAFLR
jgi:hypothetical protein